jgi:hypothetical protein
MVATSIAQENDTINHPTKADLNAAISELKADLIKWMFGGFLTIAGMLIAILLKIS